jgi:hypothetical protein
MDAGVRQTLWYFYLTVCTSETGMAYTLIPIHKTFAESLTSHTRVIQTLTNVSFTILSCKSFSTRAVVVSMKIKAGGIVQTRPNKDTFISIQVTLIAMETGCT